jgi:methionyl-tRNA formyltransferase
MTARSPISTNVVLLMRAEDAEQTLTIARRVGFDLVATVVEDHQSLARACGVQTDLLLSFGTSVIVPRHLLAQKSLLALNVHGASPQFPGRDPHHFAIYHNVQEYGATLHHMTEYVDAGAIADVELFPVPADCSATELLRQAHAAGFKLIERLFMSLKAGNPPSRCPDLHWGSVKTSRKDFQALCKVDCSMSEDELLRRKRAVATPGYRNLHVEFHGLIFRLDEPST